MSKALRLCCGRVVLFLTISFPIPVVAQVPTIERSASPADVLTQARDWVGAGFILKAAAFLEQHADQLSAVDSRDELLYLLARCYNALGRHEDALYAGVQYLKEYPSGTRRKEVLFIQGTNAYHIERYDVAIESLETLVRDYPASDLVHRAYYWLSRAELDRGNHERATHYAGLAHGNTSDGHSGNDRQHTLMLLALAAERAGRTSEARERLDTLLREFHDRPSIVDARIRLASLSFRDGDFASARSHLQEVAPTTARQRNEWLYLLAEAEYWSNNVSPAQARYRELLRAFPAGRYSRQGRHGLAWTFLRQGNFDEARRQFRELANGKDSIAELSLYQSGAIALLQGSTSEATDAFEELTRRFPYDGLADNAFFLVGGIRYRAKQFAEARRNFQLAARLFPEGDIRAQAYRMLGEASLAIGDLRSAQFAFSQVYRSDQSGRITDRDLIPDSRYKEGIVLYHLGRFNTSVDRFGDFIRNHATHPRIPDAHFWRGEALYQAGKFEEAEQEFSAATTLMGKDNPRRLEALYGVAWALFEQKKFRRAIAAFDRFIQEYPRTERFVDATLRKADCYFFLREYDTANQLYANLSTLKSDPRVAEYAAFQLGLSFIQRGDTERGVERLRDFLRRNPNSPYVEVAQFNIAWAYFSREQYGRAYAELRTFEREYPESQLMPRVLLNSGDAMYNAGQYDTARVYYQRVIEEYPTSLLVPDAINGLQFTFQAQGRSREAVAVIEGLIAKREKEEGSEELLLQKSDILFAQGDFGRAAAEYLRILDLRPSDSLRAKVLYQLGRIYELENNLHEAATYFNRVVADFPGTDVAPTALLSAGLIAVRQNRWSDARAVFGRFPELYPESPLRWEAEYNLGVAYVGLKNMADARQQFLSIIGHAPRDEVFADRSRLQIARMDQQAKEHTAAIDTLTDVILRRDDDIAAEALLLRGELYLTVKKSSDALESFNSVIEGFAGYPLLVERALLGAGECHERLNETSRAREMYQRIVDSAIDAGVKKDAEDRLRRLR
jgi:TolA-binding protein